MLKMLMSPKFKTNPLSFYALSWPCNITNIISDTVIFYDADPSGRAV